MQQTRMKKAIKLWQQATGKQDVLPDLGVLLEWLMAEPERLKEVAENWRSMEQASSLMASVRKVRVEKQRRHRKWALKEMKEKQALWRNYCGEVSEQMDKVERCRREIDYLRKRVKKAEAEVKRLKRMSTCGGYIKG